MQCNFNMDRPKEDDDETEPIDIESGAESEEYGLENVLEAVGEEVEEVDNDYPYGRPSNWSYITDELGSLTPYTEEEDDIDARLVILDRKLMIHSFRNLTLESLKGEGEKMEGNESKYLPQYIHLSNKGKQDMFGEWMNSIEHLDAYVTDKATDMEIDGECTNYMDEDPLVLMLREEGICWDPPAIVEATTELKN
ncbi:hypothetical protein SO802_012153 [Lithocarpus litseifolius]|uniref:Uncharacterized protein n=1 Tax=Lithocarpus litseifolius TaxID=425828 RepID=A0AAW2D437_9ROSI